MPNPSRWSVPGLFHVTPIALVAVVAVAGLAAAHGARAGLAAGGLGLAIVAAHAAILGAAGLAVVFGAHRHGAHGATAGHTLHSARAYDWIVRAYTFGGEGRFRRRTLDAAGLREGERVLDVCCGTGTLSLAAADRVGDRGVVVGVDASTEMVDRARAKASGRAVVRFEVAPAQALPFPDGSFDVVFCTLGLHHLPERDRVAALGEMRRVLAPDGRVVIVEFTTAPGAASVHPVALLHTRSDPHVLDEAREAMIHVGFAEVSADALGFPGMGYVRGRRPSTEA